MQKRAVMVNPPFRVPRLDACTVAETKHQEIGWLELELATFGTNMYLTPRETFFKPRNVETMFIDQCIRLVCIDCASTRRGEQR